MDPFDPTDGTPEAELDLHGFRAHDVATYLDKWLQARCRQRPGALVHVITGKGRNSPGGPVLKSMVRRALAADSAKCVAAWSRDENDGGFLVRLKGGRW
jgi:DNA-nicking Smr family endonuclease